MYVEDQVDYFTDERGLQSESQKEVSSLLFDSKEKELVITDLFLFLRKE